MAWAKVSNIKGPTGQQGVQGNQGLVGNTGPAGQGVPTGGTTGQVLTKTSNTDYETAWQTPASGGGGSGGITNQQSIINALIFG